jgi:hypothetical protein
MPSSSRQRKSAPLLPLRCLLPFRLLPYAAAAAAAARLGLACCLLLAAGCSHKQRC